MRDTLTVIVPTYNEEINLPKCLASIARVGAKVIVLDSGSTDKTAEIARSHGCELISGTWRTFSDKINWLLDQLPAGTRWVMRVDADEVINHDLAEELEEKLDKTPEHVSAFEVNRHYYFLGRWMKYGGMSPSWSVRVWRHGKARMEVRELDEHMVVDGDVARFNRGAVEDENLKGLSDWINKHNGYADSEVSQLLGHAVGRRDHLKGQRLRRRYLKEEIYHRTPLFVRPVAYWIYRYLFHLGFLDGRAGFIYHTLHAFWYRLLIDAKLYERRLRGG